MALTAQQQALLDKQSLQYGDYNVTRDWNFAYSPSKGAYGEAGAMVFNPNDPTQKFYLDANSSQADELTQYLSAYGTKNDNILDTPEKQVSKLGLPENQLMSLFEGQKTLQQLSTEANAKKISETMAQSTQATAPATGGSFNPTSTLATPESQIQQPKAPTQPEQPREQNQGGGQPASDTQQPEQNANVQQGNQQVAPIFSGANLQQGSQGQAVSQLQSALGGLVVDGKFGPKTMAAVKSFQLSRGLTPDGIVGPQTMQALNAQYGGSPVDTVQAGITSSTEEQSPETKVSTGNPLIDTLLDRFDNQSPQKTFSEVYTDIYKQLGVDTLKKSYETQVDEYSKLQEKKNDEIQDINNNPWYSEGVRVKKLNQLDSKYEGRELIFQNKIKLLEADIDNSRQDAQFMAGKMMDELNQTQKLNQDIILKAIDIAEKQLEASSKLPASAQEYEYAQRQGYQGSYMDYQTEDANRKRSVTNINGVGGNLNSKQYGALNQITTKFQADPIINLAVKGSTANIIADQIIKNPGSATNQLKSLYVLVKNLDPDSAVREGELALANQTQSYFQTFKNSIARISEGRVISPSAAVALAQATKELMGAWNQTATKRQTQYNSQANILGIGEEFDSYIQGSNLGYNESATTPSKFDYLSSQITVSGNNAYIPLESWAKLSKQDRAELKAEAEADGYSLITQ